MVAARTGRDCCVLVGCPRRTAPATSNSSASHRLPSGYLGGADRGRPRGGRAVNSSEQPGPSGLCLLLGVDGITDHRAGQRAVPGLTSGPGGRVEGPGRGDRGSRELARPARDTVRVMVMVVLGPPVLGNPVGGFPTTRQRRIGSTGPRTRLGEGPTPAHPGPSKPLRGFTFQGTSTVGLRWNRVSDPPGRPEDRRQLLRARPGRRLAESCGSEL